MAEFLIFFYLKIYSFLNLCQRLPPPAPLKKIPATQLGTGGRLAGPGTLLTPGKSSPPAGKKSELARGGNPGSGGGVAAPARFRAGPCRYLKAGKTPQIQLSVFNRNLEVKKPTKKTEKYSKRRFPNLCLQIIVPSRLRWTGKTAIDPWVGGGQGLISNQVWGADPPSPGSGHPPV